MTTKHVVSDEANNLQVELISQCRNTGSQYRCNLTQHIRTIVRVCSDQTSTRQETFTVRQTVQMQTIHDVWINRKQVSPTERGLGGETIIVRIQVLQEFVTRDVSLRSSLGVSQFCNFRMITFTNSVRIRCSSFNIAVEDVGRIIIRNVVKAITKHRGSQRRFSISECRGSILLEHVRLHRGEHINRTLRMELRTIGIEVIHVMLTSQNLVRATNKQPTIRRTTFRNISDMQHNVRIDTDVIPNHVDIISISKARDDIVDSSTR